MVYRIKKGLDVPLAGEPEPVVEAAPPVTRVALTAGEHHDLKPGVVVAEGDTVRLGQTVFFHKTYKEVRFVAPATGVVEKINRGKRRKLQSVVIRVEENERNDGEEPSLPALFEPCTIEQVRRMSREKVVSALTQGGLWPTLRTRPYSNIANPQSLPASIFVTAMDTRPLAAPAGMIIGEAGEAFNTGLHALTHLSNGQVYVCHAPGDTMPAFDGSRVRYVRFEGPHPAGLVGTHIHFIDPVTEGKEVWTINYADVIAIGSLLLKGQFPTERVVALTGPIAKRPRMLRTRVGACISELYADELLADAKEYRLISGSVLDGIEATGACDFLHRFSTQITALPLRPKRRLFGWIRPGLDLFSVANVLFSKLIPWRKFAFDCGYNGSARAIVPIGLYERVFPLETLPTQLLKALLVGDTGMAQQLGCLELDEEDLALCTYVCPGKHEFGPVLRSNLSHIEREG